MVRETREVWLTLGLDLGLEITEYDKLKGECRSDGPIGLRNTLSCGANTSMPQEDENATHDHGNTRAGVLVTKWWLDFRIYHSLMPDIGGTVDEARECPVMALGADLPADIRMVNYQRGPARW